MKLNFFKIIVCFLLLMFVFPESSEAQQDGMFKGKNKHRHRHKGRRERKNKTAYNPYIDPDTNKPKKLASKELTKDNKRVERQQKKNIRREKRKLRRTKGAYK
ncbi:MAG: hypothetical protein Q8M29_19700 [Bacteroidota bacterium]|nr:hypothetical protein [Bacteroidota bacterium]